MHSLKVKDYMAKKLVTFTPEMNVVEAMTQILANSFGGAGCRRERTACRHFIRGGFNGCGNSGQLLQ